MALSKEMYKEDNTDIICRDLCRISNYAKHCNFYKEFEGLIYEINYLLKNLKPKLLGDMLMEIRFPWDFDQMVLKELSNTDDWWYKYIKIES